MNKDKLIKSGQKRIEEYVEWYCEYWDLNENIPFNDMRVELFINEQLDSQGQPIKEVPQETESSPEEEKVKDKRTEALKKARAVRKKQLEEKAEEPKQDKEEWE